MKEKLSSFLAGILFISAIPLCLGQSLLQDKQQTQVKIQSVLDTAFENSQLVPKVAENKEKFEQALEKSKVDMRTIMQDKRTVRMQIVAQKKIANEFKIHYGIEPTDADHIFDLYTKRSQALNDYVKQYSRLLALQNMQAQASLQSSLTLLLHNSSLVQFETMARQKVFLAAQEKLVELAQSAKQIPTVLGDLTAKHEDLLTAYHSAADAEQISIYNIEMNQAKLDEIKNIMAQVEERVRVMQLEMSRIDSKLRMKAEQDLIAMGLRTTQRVIVSRRDTFIWPVVGRITATFHDKAYQAFFGVPHNAIDIAAPQATAIKVAADGIVYFVKNGGAKGYSYILVGHRDGYATLYGHVLQSNVKAGQQVMQGEIIGLSGGRPGTVGAGPMTTGPHLHLEFIKDGVHIDPLTVLNR